MVSALSHSESPHQDVFLKTPLDPFLIDMTKYCTRRNLRQEGFYFCLKLDNIMAGKAWQQINYSCGGRSMPLDTLWPESGSKEILNLLLSWLPPFPPLIQSVKPQHRMVPTVFSDGFFFSKHSRKSINPTLPNDS